MDKVKKVMDEFKSGKLKSSAGGKVSNPKQAIAIALSEARKAGQQVSPEPKKKKSVMKQAIERMKYK